MPSLLYLSVPCRELYLAMLENKTVEEANALMERQPFHILEPRTRHEAVVQACRSFNSIQPETAPAIVDHT